MGTEGSVRDRLIQKYGIGGNGSSGGTAQTSGQSVREQLLNKYSLENVQSRQDTVSDWVNRYNKTVQGIYDYRDSLGDGYTADSSGGYRTELESLIRDYDAISEYASRTGLPNAQRYLKNLQDILQNVSEFDSYMAQFADEEDYTRKMTEQKAAQREYDWMNADEEDYSLYAGTRAGKDRLRYFDGDTAKSGWEAYQKDRQTPGDEKTWAEKVTQYLGGIPADTSQIAAQFDIAKKQYAADTSWQEPDERWSDWMRENFGYLYATDPEAAKEFAAEINDALNRRDRTGQEEAILAGATGSIPGAAMHTAGALLGAPFGIADYLDAVAEYAGRGRISEKAYMTPASYAQTVTGGVAEHLNEQHGTLDERIPVIGGKGWGDVYGLGTSIAQSSLAAATGGQLGTLVQFFGSAAASGVQDAKNRGASDEQALMLGTLQGLAEGLAEQAGVDNLLKVGASSTWKELAMNLLKQGGAEGIEEGLTTLLNNISDQIVMQDQSVFYTLVEKYMEDGMEEGDAKKQAWLDMVNDIAFDMLGGFVSGAAHAGPRTAAETYLTGREMKTTYGDYQQELVETGLQSPEGSANLELAQQLRQKLDAGKDLSGSDLYRIVRANTAQAAAERLTELGETGDVQAMGEAIAAQMAGQPLSRAQEKLLSRENAGTVMQELKTGRTAQRGAADAQEAVHTEQEQPVQTASETEKAAQTAAAETVVTAQGNRRIENADDPVATVRENRTVQKAGAEAASGQQVTGKLTAEDSTEVQQEQTIEQAAKAYGAQAGAMLHTYRQGQDVKQYDQAYRAAYDMGRSGVSMNYVKTSPMTAYLTETQKELAHRAGAAAANAEAQNLATANKGQENGNQIRRKGTVKGEGVTVEDLKKGFNDQQGRAYRYLASVAEATGVDIVLYKSEVSESDGRYQGAQGRFVWDENKIYIDVNAGLSYAKDAGEAAKYAMLRTFGHEFTHFIEKWNPVQYNDFRETVFQALEERGENVNDLIEEKMALDESGSMTYEQASREVVAEAMTDILPDSNFVQELAQRNQTVFQKLLEKLKEFTDNLRNYFQSLGSNRSREANALKEQVGDTVKYLDSIVKLFDEAAVGAVENYQKGAEGSSENGADIQKQSRERADISSTTPYDGKSLYGSKEIYSYEFMSSQKDMDVIEMPSLKEVKTGQKVDQKKAVEMGLKNAESIGREVGKNQYAIRNAYTGREIIVGTSGLSHSLTGDNVNRLRTNARLSAVGGEIVQNAIPVNGLKNKNRQATGTYAMACLLSSGDYHVVAIVTVEEHTSNAVGIDYVDITHSINGRIKAKNIDSRSSTGEMGNGQLSAPTTATYSVSISDFLRIVNDTHKSILSDDVLSHFEEKRPETGYYSDKVRYQQRTDTLTDRDVLKAASAKLREGNLSKAEQDALDIFDRRMSRLEALQQERENQDRLYQEQKSGENPNSTEAAMTRNRVKELDRQIRNAGNDVLEVENKTILRKLLQKGKQIVEQQERARSQRVLENYRKNRAESRDKTAMRHKIRKTVRELDRLLNRGDKKKNVKEGMSAMVSKSLSLADALFTEEYTNRDMLRNGVTVQMTDTEEAAFQDAKKLLQTIESGNFLESKEFDSEIAARNYLKNLDGQLSRKLSKLKDVFDRERKMLSGTTVSDLLGQLADEYSRLSEAEDGAVRAAKDENVYAHLLQIQKDVKDTRVREMTAEQMEAVADAYTMVLTTVRNANKLFAKNLKFRRDVLSGMVIKEIGDGAQKASKLVAPGKTVRDTLSWNNLKPVYAFERIGSETLKTLYKNIREGQDIWAVDMQEADAFRREQYKKHNRKKWDTEKRHTFELESGEVELNTEQIMSLYAYSRRKQALDHLLKGGFVFAADIEVTVNKKGVRRRYLKRDATAYRLTAEELIQITDTLTPEQREFAEQMQKYLSETMGEKGNEVSMQMYGIKSFGEENYFPIRSAGQYMERAKEDSFRKEQGQISIVNSGFTKSTTPKASNPITLSGFMDVWSEHVNDMSMYHGFALPMEDFRRVYSYSSPNAETGKARSVNAAIENSFGRAATGYLDQLYKDLNGGAVTDSRESFAKKLVGLHKKAAVFTSLSVVVQQPSSIARAFALIDPVYFLGPRIDQKKHRELWAEIKRYAPVAFVKEMGYFDTGMGKSAKDYLQAEEYGEVNEKVLAFFKDGNYRDEVLGKLPALADEMAWCNIWEAVKREIRDRNKELDIKSEAFLQKVGERFSEVIDKTQVYDSVLSRSANMRAKSMFMNMLTSFMAEPTTSINMVEDSLRKGNWKQAARTIGSVLGSVLLNSMLVSLVYAARDEDEEETFWEKYLSRLAVEVLDGINPASYYPFLRDVLSAAQGFDVERADMSLITDFVNAVNKVTKAIQKAATAEENDRQTVLSSVSDALWTLADSLSGLAGIPVKNFRRDIEAAGNLFKTIAADWTKRDTSALSLKDAVLEEVMGYIPVANELYSNTKADRLYRAVIAGDEAYIKRLKDSYKTESAYKSATRAALRENDSRIWEAAKLWNEGDLEGYMKIAKEIVGEKHFTQDDVVLAIRAEAAAMEEKKTSSNSDRAYGYYTADKFGVAVSQGNDEMAKIIRQDLIDTAMKNGKSERDAESSFNTSARSAMKELWLEGKLTDEAAVKAMADYCGNTREEAEQKVAEWSFARDNGFGYDEKAQQFKDGKITGEELKDMLMETGGKSAEEAAAAIVSYSRDAYEEGYFSREETAKILTEYGGLTDAEAEGKLRYIDFKLENPGVSVDDAWVDEYYNEVESSGISIEVFVDYRNKVKGITGSGKKESRMAVIDSLPISDAQKDALYYAEGWAESKIWQAPWRK